jgi:hypothetical protein
LYAAKWVNRLLVFFENNSPNDFIPIFSTAFDLAIAFSPSSIVFEITQFKIHVGLVIESFVFSSPDMQYFVAPYKSPPHSHKPK